MTECRLGALFTSLIDTYPVEAPLTHSGIDIAHLDPEDHDTLGDVLGEGEVSIRIDGNPLVLIQETRFVGVWRTLKLDAAGKRLSEHLDFCPMPRIVVDRARSGQARTIEIQRTKTPVSDMAYAVLHELREYLDVYSRTAEPQITSLTHLPVGEKDIALLIQMLGVGPVSILSGGHAPCLISSTGVTNIWWLRYLNDNNTVKLQTLEVVDIPLAAVAAPEDLEDSANALADVLKAGDFF